MNEYYKKFEKFDKGNCSTVVIGKDANQLQVKLFWDTMRTIATVLWNFTLYRE